MTESFSTRSGNFTSSECVKLLGVAKRKMTAEEKAQMKIENPKSRSELIEDLNLLPETALTYIREKNIERRLGQSLELESNAKPLVWGKICEKYVFENLLKGYVCTSDETLTHPKFVFWKGTPDGLKKSESTVAELKCPATLKSFVQLVQPLYDGLLGINAMNAIRFGYTDENGVKHKPHDKAEDYYWQCVSNAILTNSKYAVLIIFCPYESEKDSIIRIAEHHDNSWFIQNGEFQTLKDDGYYSNINAIHFEVPQKDKDFLTDRMEKAGKLLIKM